jgi:DNA-binding transcriptional ArsR family regulator
MNFVDLEKIHKALANRRRLAIIKFLLQNEEANVFDIAEKIRLSFKSTSRHLQILKQAGLVESEQMGLQQHYHLLNNANSVFKHTLSQL